MYTSAEELSKVIVSGMQEKKACDIVVMDLRKMKNAVADFFVICSGGAVTQLSAIVKSVDEMVFKAFRESPRGIEGKDSEQWVLLDYVTVMAHVFQEKRRSVYELEKLWGNAEIIRIEE